MNNDKNVGDDFLLRLFYLVANGITVGLLALFASKDWIMPIIGLWILTEVCIIRHKIEKKDEPEPKEIT